MTSHRRKKNLLIHCAHTREKRLLPLSCTFGLLSICPSACIGPAAIGRIYVKFSAEDFH